MWDVAAVAAETGIAPNDLLDTDADLFDTLVSYLIWRSKQK